MDDFLPILLFIAGLFTIALMVAIIYSLSFIMEFPIAFFLTAGVFSLIFSVIIYYLAANIDNKDATKIIKQVMVIVVIANILVISGNFLKIFAINF